MAVQDLRLLAVIVISSCIIIECDTTGRHLCGKNIPIMLSLICGGRTHGGKRADKGFSVSDMFMKGKSRVKRGIVEECCIKICSYDVLTSYCQEQPEDDFSQLLNLGRPDPSNVPSTIPPITSSTIITTIRPPRPTTPAPGQSGVVGASGRRGRWFIVLRLGGSRGRSSIG